MTLFNKMKQIMLKFMYEHKTQHNSSTIHYTRVLSITFLQTGLNLHMCIFKHVSTFLPKETDAYNVESLNTCCLEKVLGKLNGLVKKERKKKKRRN